MPAKRRPGRLCSSFWMSNTHTAVSCLFRPVSPRRALLRLASSGCATTFLAAVRLAGPPRPAVPSLVSPRLWDVWFELGHLLQGFPRKYSLTASSGDWRICRTSWRTFLSIMELSTALFVTALLTVKEMVHFHDAVRARRRRRQPPEREQRGLVSSRRPWVNLHRLPIGLQSQCGMRLKAHAHPFLNTLALVRTWGLESAIVFT